MRGLRQWLLQLLRGDIPTAEDPGAMLDMPLLRSNPEWISVGFRCATLLTDELSGMPFSAMQKDEDGVAMPAMKGSKYERLADLLTHEPSDIMNADLFWRHMWDQVNSQGNAYALIHRNRRGEVVRLEPVVRRYQRFQPYTDPFQPIEEPRYHFQEYRSRDFQGDDVLALHGPKYNARADRSPSLFDVAAVHLGYLHVATTKMTSQLQDITTYIGIEEPDPEGWAKVAKAAGAAIATAKKRGDSEVAILNGRVYFRQMRDGGGTESQVQKLRWEAEEVARIWGIPPRALPLLSEGMRTEASLIGQMSDLAQMSLAPRAKMISEEVCRKMLSHRDQKLGYRVKLDLGSELRGTLNERAEAAATLVARAGAWTPNEARALTGKPPREDGDTLLQPTGGPMQGDDRQSPGAPGSGDD